MTGRYIDTQKGKFRYTVDMTIFRGLEERGIGNDEMLDNIQTVLEHKTKQLLSVCPRKPPSERKMKYQYLATPKKIHKEATELWGWQRRTWGAGSILNVGLADSVLEMKRLGIVSFNEYCDRIRSGKL